MKNISLERHWVVGSICLCSFPIAMPSFGQSPGEIIPDATQPVNSIVTVDGDNRIITGGTTAGSNLFHSFQEFSLPTGTRAMFNNGLTIDNIITRVTGDEISEINGTISTNGTANLFLLNPNGIIFGPNAELNIGGSFFASTAESVTFADGSEYSAINPQAPPLLNVNVPIGLQLGQNPGTIVNRSRNSLNEQVVGLAVQPGQTIGLIGGNLSLEGGHLNAIEGKVELAAIANAEWPLSSENQIAGELVGNIELSQQAAVNTSGGGGGEIQITGGAISLKQGSQILADTRGDVDGRGITIQGARLTLENDSLISSSTLGAGAAGPIRIAASQVDVIGTNNSTIIQALLGGTFSLELLRNGIFSISDGAGAAGNVTLEIDRITLAGGAAILTSTLGPNLGGNFTIDATDSVELFDGSAIATGTTQSGSSGEININTNVLRMRDGSLITTTSTLGSEGAVGNLTVNADNLIEISNTPSQAITPGGLFTVTLGRGSAGDLAVTTRQLVLRDGSHINSSSSGAGLGGRLTVNVSEFIEINGVSPDAVWVSGLYTNSSLLQTEGLSGTSPAGNLIVNTGRLMLSNGGSVSASTGGEGSAGSVQINASIAIEIAGLGNTAILERQEPTALLANSIGSGQAGDLRIKTRELIVRDRGFISVSGTGAGNAGNLEISAESIQLKNATLNAATASGEGGNIFLNSQILQLRENSNISTEAGGSGNGGNITIHAGAIAALENSDIIANASQGFGGRVIINSQGIFGTEFRQQLTPMSDITATSELGPQFSGVVNINTPEVEPAAGLVELKSNLVDLQSLVDRDVCATPGSNFYITGRGGLPPTPDEPLSSDTVWVDDRATANSQPSTQHAGDMTPDIHPDIHPEIIEATGWAIAPNGRIMLTANESFLSNGPDGWRNHPSCSKEIYAR